VAEKFQTRLDVQRPQKSLGLTKEQASELLKTNGHNAITPSPKKPMWLQFLMHFLNPFNVMLIVSGFLSLVLYAIDHSQTVNVPVSCALAAC
jgi:magnesium-transporting ATPase (P-type)